jgi:cell pole-organizing protein PopZ
MILEEMVDDEPAAPAIATDPEPAADLAEAGRDAFLAEVESVPTDDSSHTVDDSLSPVGDSGLDKHLSSLHSDSEHVGLVSPPVREQSTLTFAELAGAIHARGFSLGNVGMTLEDLIRDLLRPHLKDWLDRNLPGIVERMVRAEIERMVREAEERKDLL